MLAVIGPFAAILCFVMFLKIVQLLLNTEIQLWWYGTHLKLKLTYV